MVRNPSGSEAEHGSAPEHARDGSPTLGDVADAAELQYARTGITRDAERAVIARAGAVSTDARMYVRYCSHPDGHTPAECPDLSRTDAGPDAIGVTAYGAGVLARATARVAARPGLTYADALRETVAHDAGGVRVANLAGTRWRPDTLPGGEAPADYAPAVRHVWRFGGYALAPGATLAAVCPDYTVRRVRITGEPDTFYTVPAAVRVHGRTVGGYITAESEPGADNRTADPYGAWRTVYRFTARADGRNAGAFGPDR